MNKKQKLQRLAINNDKHVDQKELSKSDIYNLNSSLILLVIVYLIFLNITL